VNELQSSCCLLLWIALESLQFLSSQIIAIWTEAYQREILLGVSICNYPFYMCLWVETWPKVMTKVQLTTHCVFRLSITLRNNSTLDLFFNHDSVYETTFQTLLIFKSASIGFVCILTKLHSSHIFTTEIIHSSSKKNPRLIIKLHNSKHTVMHLKEIQLWQNVSS